jgi:hypothetical protein
MRADHHAQPGNRTLRFAAFFDTRLDPNFSAGSSAGPARNRRSFAPSLATKSADLQAILAGATGLEPATSGVTGLFPEKRRLVTIGAESLYGAALRRSGTALCTFA